jgi:cytochrome c oxidase assembly protein subunit 15
MQNKIQTDTPHDSPVIAWLWVLFFTLFVMVMLGGITRLTGSGLSMVDWRPLMGILPPMNDEEWNAVFAAYKASPQFALVNTWMEFGDFKKIFFWEYAHRLMGRLIGVVAFVPWVYFVLRGKIASWLSVRVVVAIVLGGAQGLLGWFMVQSGLVDRPEVSHFRLAAHLLLAFFIAQWVLLTLFDLHWGRVRLTHNRESRWMLGIMATLAVQILYGAFMAGTHAGLLFPTFPDMNGGYAPSQFFPLATVTENLLYSPIAIHYTHRFLGFALVGLAAGVLFAMRNTRLTPEWSKAQFAAVMLFQFVLGAFTALYQATLSLAILHQAGALLLACSVTLLAHRSAGSVFESITAPSDGGAD